jgi:glycosyltransferase involved in cell wall biosynthesis
MNIYDSIQDKSFVIESADKFSEAVKPLISIAIPFRNPGAYFELAVRSVFAQSYIGWELLLIDDGSSDGSVEWARRINDPRVQIIVDGVHRNLAARLNQAAQLARGRFLVRMDADDVMHPRRVELLMFELLRVNSDTVVGSWAYTIDSDSNPVGLRRGSRRDDGWHARLRFIHPTVAAHTAWFRTNPYSEHAIYNRGEDAELWVRTRQTTRRLIVPEPLLYYREVGIYRHEAYLKTGLALRAIINEMGGWRWAIRRLRLKASNVIMNLSFHLGIANYWVRRRSAPIEGAQIDIANMGLAQVRRAIIPGIE